MTTENWIQLEYQSLRQEILAQMEVEQSAVRFFLPAAAVVYTVPYLLQQPHDVFLWSVCAGLAGLLVCAMSYTLLASVDGVRKIGMYIKEAIEPRTGGGLRWEAVVYQWDQHEANSWWPSETAVVVAGAIIANIAAAFGAGALFLQGRHGFVPAVIATLLGALAVPSVIRLSRFGTQRGKYSAEVRGIIAGPEDPI